MKKINPAGYIARENIELYVIGKPEEVQELREQGLVLNELNIKSGDALLLYYEDPWDHDDDFAIFDVKEGEQVYEVIKV
jgi:hypothetical protein